MECLEAPTTPTQPPSSQSNIDTISIEAIVLVFCIDFVTKFFLYK